MRDRVSAHRDREEPGVPHLDPGRDVRDPNGLPVTVFQRDRLLPGGGGAAGHHRRDPGARFGDPRHDDGAEPDLQPPGGTGHRRHGAGRHDRDVSRVPRARARPGDLRDDHRAADEPRLHPSRWGGGRSSGRGAAAAARTDGPAAQAPARSRGPAQRELHLEGPHPGRRLPRPDRLHGAGGDRPGAALHRPTP